MGEPASGDLGLDDLDAALNNLEVKLKGSAPSDMLVRRGLGWEWGWGQGQGQVGDPRFPLTSLSPRIASPPSRNSRTTSESSG